MLIHNPSVYSLYVKPAADRIVALILLLVFAPIIIFVGVLLLVSNRGSGVLFIQTRPGKNGNPFRILKFKTMPDGLTISRLGGFLRKTSLDELPQLFNVLSGDMSLVGPRPLLTKYLALYSERQASRHWVKPGITGLAQVMGRNNTTWNRRLAIDCYYTRNQSFKLDVFILCRTIFQIFKTSETSNKEHLSMPEFEG